MLLRRRQLGDDSSDDVSIDSIANDITAFSNAAVQGYNAVTLNQLNQQLVAKGIAPITNATTPEQLATEATTSSGTTLLYGLLALGISFYVLTKK